jgi:tetratricopeptide (TPR) repeat protein
MVSKKEQELKTEKRLENIEETLTRSETFIVENQKTISIVVGVILLIVLGVFGYTKYIIEPKTQDAQDQIFYAQQFFQADSLDKALYGDGNHLGFIDIAEEYSGTKPGNLANYYAGISFLKKGDFDKAIDYLSKFDSDDKMVIAMAKGAIGDAYLEKGDKDKAVDFYLKAATIRDNNFTSPLFYFKAAKTYELMDNYGKALENYEIIRQKYPRSKQALEIDRYIARAETKLGK